MKPEDQPAEDDCAPAAPQPPPAEGRPAEGHAPEGAAEAFPPDTDLAAVAEEERAVNEAAEAVATGRVGPTSEPERAFLYGVALLALLLLFGWIGGTTVWKLRQDVQALEARLSGFEARSQSAERLQARAALLRVRAELQALREGLPEALAAGVGEADRILEDVERRHAESP